MISINDAYKLPVFNQIVRSYRYEDVKRLFKANRIRGHWPLWLSQEVERNIKEGYNGTEIVKNILNTYGVAIRTKNIHKRVKKLEKWQT